MKSSLECEELKTDLSELKTYALEQKMIGVKKTQITKATKHVLCVWPRHRH